MINSSEERNWLVKSSGKIFGPFSQPELAHLLKRRKISVIDEIRQPTGRWGFIREHQDFSRVVQDLRKEDARYLDEVTAVDLVPSNGSSAENFFDDDKTPQPLSVSDMTNLEVSSSTEAIDLRSTVGAQYSGPEKQVVKSYAMPNIKSPFRRLVLGLWAIFFITVAGGSFYLFRERSVVHKSLSAQDYINLAKSSRAIGNFSSALDYYAKAQNLKELDLNSKVQAAILMLEVGGQTVEARRLAEEVIAKVPEQDRLRHEAEMVKGLAAMKEMDHLKAEEIFKSILISMPNSNEARLNLAMNFQLRAQPDEALKEILSAQQRGMLEPQLYLAKVIAILDLYDEKPERSARDLGKLTELVSDLRELNSHSNEFRIESLLLLSVLSEKLKKREDTIAYIQQMFDEDIFLSKDFVHSLMIDRQLFSWQRLSSYCSYLTTHLLSSAVGKALTSFCLLQRGDSIEGLKVLEEGLQQYPQDFNILAQKAAVLLDLHRGVEAQQVAKIANSNSNLAERILGESCEEAGDYFCAEESWNRLITKKQNDLKALHGLALIQYKLNHRDRALDFISRGLVFSPNYRPLLELKEKLDAP